MELMTESWLHLSRVKGYDDILFSWIYGKETILRAVSGGRKGKGLGKELHLEGNSMGTTS